MSQEKNEAHERLVTLTSDIVSAHVGNNSVAVSELPNLIANVFQALAATDKQDAPEEKELTPAVPIRSSVKNEYIVCLEDGAKLKMLKRYLFTRFNLTTEQYRQRWNLPSDYPMVAPAYAEKRRELARKIGLGKKAPPSKPLKKVAAKRGRKPAAVPA
jgi:predicted transcriptional regulator